MFTVVLMAMSPVLGTPSPDGESVTAARAAVENWLAVVDRKDYGKSWELLAKNTRGKISKDQWIELLKSTVDPLGPVQGRKFITSIPLGAKAATVGMEGLDLIYESAFAERPFGLDDFPVVRESGGEWRVALYRSTFRSGKPMGFAIPAASWWLELPFADIEMNELSVKPDGRSGYFRMGYKDTGMIVSFWIEPATKCTNSEACRDMTYDANMPKVDHPVSLAKGQIGEVRFFEYFLPKFKGQEVKQQNFYAEFVADGWWIDMHVSKVGYTSDDHRLFEDLVKAVQFVPKSRED